MKEVHLGSIEKRLVGNKCPACGRVADGGTSIDDKETKRMPKPGDFGVCLYCGSLNQYGADLMLVRLDRKERRRLLRDPRMKELAALVSWAAQKMRREWQ